MPDDMDKYYFLRWAVSATSTMREKNRCRIELGWNALGKHSHIMNSRLPL